MLYGGLTGIAGRAAAVLVGVITLPLTVRYLGPVEYGIWVTISSSVVMLAVLDLGIASSLTNSISRAFADDDPEAARRDYSTAFWIACGIAAAIGLAGLLVYPSIRWETVFHLTDPKLAQKAGRCAAVSFAFFALSMPLGLVNKVLGGYQRVPVANAFGTLSSVLSLGAILVVIGMHGDIVLLAVAFCTAMLTGSVLANLWVAFRHEPRVRAHPRAFQKSAAKDILQQGLPFFILQLAAIIVFSSDNFVIAHYLGAGEVTPYSVTWRLTSYAGMLQNLFVPSLWPAFTEAYLRKDMVWLRATYRRIMRGTMLSVGMGAVFAGTFGRWIIQHWAGAEAVPSATLLWCMCLWAVMVSYTINQAALMAATQRLKLQAISSSLAAAVNLTLSIVLVQRIGALGVLLATILSYILLVLVPQAWEVRRILSGSYLEADPTRRQASRGPWWKRLLRPVRDTVGRSIVHGRLFRLYAPQAAPEEESKPHKVALCHLIGNLGDQVMMLPLLDAIHAENPELHITCFSDPIGRFLALHPAVNELCLIPRDGSKPHPVRRILNNIGVWKRLFRTKRFHTVVVPRGGIEPFGSHHFAWMLGGHKRFGYAARLEPERPTLQFHESSLFTAQITKKHGAHEVERGAEVMRLAGLLSAPINICQASQSLLVIAGLDEGRAFCAEHGLLDRPFAILSPGASMPRRTWPTSRLIEVARRAYLRRGWLPVIVGGPELAPVAQEMLRELDGEGLDLTGKTNFTQLAAVCAQAQCFVGNDSGTGHVSGAVGVPTVVVAAYASNSPPTDHASPLRSHPVGPAVSIVQPAVQLTPCLTECVADEAHCIATVSADEVERGLESLLSLCAGS